MRSLYATLFVLSVAVAQSASAYNLSPPDITAHLKGRLLFVPGSGAGKSVRCKVQFKLKTGDRNSGFKHFPEIVSATIEGGKCVGYSFGLLPWHGGPESATMAQFGPLFWSNGEDRCDQGGLTFTVDANGDWTTLSSGQCVTGTMTSRPVVTIVP